jgi:putative ABC transport system substrate-binding protein
VKRREFIALAGGAAVTASLPFAAQAQQVGKVPTVGFLGTPAAPIWKSYTAAFVQRLGEFGWIDGRTVGIEFRWAEGRSERFDEIAAEFVRLKVDVILTSGAAVNAVKQATSTIPIVFAIGADPVGGGHVASLGRPGGNVTGLSLQATEVAGKRLELLRELIPGLRRLAVLGNFAYPASAVELAEVETFARALGYDVTKIEIRSEGNIDAALASLKGGADALYICGYDPFVNTHRIRINALANAARVPTVSGDRAIVLAGSLISYGPSFTDMFRRSADYVDKILRGAKPGELPVQQPTKFELIVNLKTAKAIGLDLSPMFLARADEIIE